MNILVTICGRAGSKGLKGKNLKSLLGHPLSYYPLSALDLWQRSAQCDDTIHVCASSDSAELLNQICEQKIVQVFPIVRSEDLSADSVAKVFVSVDCLKLADNYFGVAHDIVIDLDITSPLRTVDDIVRAVEQKKRLPDADVVFSVVPARRNPYFNMVLQKDGTEFYEAILPMGFTTRQQAPKLYDMNASIYVYSREYLLRSDLTKRKNAVIEMKDTAVLDIDSEEDYIMMELIARHLFSAEPLFREIYENLRHFY